MRPKFLPRGRVTTEEPPIERSEFDEFSQNTFSLFAKSAVFVTAFVIGGAQVIAWVAERIG